MAKTDKVVEMAKKDYSYQESADYERNRMLAERQRYAISNSKDLIAQGGVSPLAGDRAAYYSNPTDQLIGGKIKGTQVDARFISDMQNMKFCRKPIGFIMWLLYLVCLAVLVISFILPRVGVDIPMLTQYTSLCLETTPTVADEGGEDAEIEEDAENAAIKADEDAGEGDGEDGEGDGSDAEGESSSNVIATYAISDPVYGWIKFIASKLNFSIDLGDSAWYDAQIAKTEAGMTDAIAPYLIWAFPAFIVVDAVMALILMIQTFICFASGDRRIFRFTGIESFIMLLLGAGIFFGCFATTVEVNGTMDFAQILNFALGSFNGVGGFNAGVGLLALVAIPLIGFILSFFLLEKKLRGREITQPIVVYHYKEK